MGGDRNRSDRSAPKSHIMMHNYPVAPARVSRAIGQMEDRSLIRFLKHTPVANIRNERYTLTFGAVVPFESTRALDQ